MPQNRIKAGQHLATALQPGRDMFRTFSIPITWSELLRRTVREASADNVLGLAAQLAYYLLLALVPAIVFLAALTSLFPPSLLEQILAGLSAGSASRGRRHAARSDSRQVAGGSTTAGC